MGTSEIAQVIASCEWFNSSFLIFSDNVFAPLIYYSHLGAVIPTLLIGFFVFINGRKELSNKLLFLTSVFFALWVFGDLTLWATEYPSYTMFAWSMLILLEPFVYFFAFYFIYSFILKKDFSLTQKLLFSLPLFPTIFLAPTNFGLLGYDLSNCDRNAYEGIAASYGYIVEILYVVLIIGYSFFAIRIAKNALERRQIFLLTSGIVAFLLSFSLGNILEVFTENWFIGQYGLFGAPIFAAFLAYIIVKFKAFNIRLIGAQVLVIALWLLVFSLLFIRTIENVHVVTIATLILIAVMGILLVRSVKREIEAREKVEGLAKELAKANQRLRELDKAKSEFVALASHQLRSPLTAIRGYASMMLEGAFGQVPEKMVEPLQRIDQSTKYMSLSVDDFLNISRIESGQMKYESSVFSLKELAENIVNELKPAAIQKGLELSFRSECKTAGNVKADVGKIRQVLQNLIDNSMKYTPKGTVTVVACDDNHHGKASVSITDTGVGMSEETKNAIFQKFVRAKNANTVNVQGTGLGLYIGKQMTEAMGGTITPFSEGEGKGSTFILELPLVS